MCGEIAQMVEQWARDWEVPGSNPAMDFEFVIFSTLVPLVAGFVSFTMLQRVTSVKS